MDGTKSILTGAVHATGATGIRSAMALLRLSAEWKQSCLRLRHLSWSGCFRKEKKTAVLNLPRAKAEGIPASRSVARCRGSYTLSTGVLGLYDSHSDELLDPFFSQVV